MSEYYAEVKWLRGNEEAYIDNKYSRGHSWKFAYARGRTQPTA